MAIVAALFDSGSIFALPVIAIFAGVVLCGISMIVLNVSVPVLPASVKVCEGSTCNVLTLKLPLPPSDTGPENCREIGPDRTAFGYVTVSDT